MTCILIHVKHTSNVYNIYDTFIYDTFMHDTSHMNAMPSHMDESQHTCTHLCAPLHRAPLSVYVTCLRRLVEFVTMSVQLKDTFGFVTHIVCDLCCVQLIDMKDTYSSWLIERRVNDMSHMNESCHIWMSHITYECVKTHIVRDS